MPSKRCHDDNIHCYPSLKAGLIPKPRSPASASSGGVLTRSKPLLFDRGLFMADALTMWRSNKDGAVVLGLLWALTAVLEKRGRRDGRLALTTPTPPSAVLQRPGGIFVPIEWRGLVVHVNQSERTWEDTHMWYRRGRSVAKRTGDRSLWHKPWEWESVFQTLDIQG